MKSAILLIVASSVALGQNLSGQPRCATACLISAISAAGCAARDIGCQCGPTQSVIAASAAPCLIASCAVSELLQAQSAGSAQCSIYSRTAAPRPASTTEKSSVISTTE
ncbi:hypothetical protein C7999DRAFT_14908 [Corynascus novoguineensis]|uniref:CFEM domain-containing protein n=1 Tax=Corynascus novoguineensis TaxID=1126955 RepID=A0AAN7HN87_9PEZI|nr:hypothetical protein C7999DRAFT_14908 [Corynascus novoguineensis]